MNFENTINLSLWSGCAGAESSLDFWIERIMVDDYYSKIIDAAAFKRLSEISFLGSLDYTLAVGGKLPIEHKSRYRHSLAVAGIAAFVSWKRGYCQERTRYLVVAALLHDIGHPPLSHSVEPYIQKKLGYGHHEAGERVIRGRFQRDKELALFLRNTLDVDHVLDLISGKVSEVEGGDLFSSKFNIDTIDGIVRSYAYIFPKKRIELNQQKLAIANSAFVCKDKRSEGNLDAFWEMKNSVYSLIINERHGLVSDKASEFYFEYEASLSEEDIYQTEVDWKKKYKKLFISLKSYMSEKKIAPWIECEKIPYMKREYAVDNSKKGMSRFVYNKYKAEMEVGFNGGVKNVRVL